MQRNRFVFQVPGFGQTDAKPLEAMGRMELEPIAVDPVTCHEASGI